MGSQRKGRGQWVTYYGAGNETGRLNGRSSRRGVVTFECVVFDSACGLGVWDKAIRVERNVSGEVLWTSGGGKERFGVDKNMIKKEGV